MSDQVWHDLIAAIPATLVALGTLISSILNGKKARRGHRQILNAVKEAKIEMTQEKGE